MFRRGHGRRLDSIRKQFHQVHRLHSSEDHVFQLDRSGDGRISLIELKSMLGQQGHNPKVVFNDEETNVLLQRALSAGQNKDETLDEEEFISMMTSKAAQKNNFRRMLYSVADTVIARTERAEVRSYLDEYTLCPPPIFIILISLTQLLVFFGYYLTTPSHDGVLTVCAGCWVHAQAGPLLFAPTLRYQAWRFLTYMFLHQGLTHLLPNLFIQLLVGVPLEVVHKFWRIAPIYLLAVTLGALLQYVLDPSVYLVGASAGVYALVLAHMSNVILNWAEMPYKWFRLVAVIGFITLDVSVAIYRRFIASECGKVSYTAHIAGAITGLLMGIVLLHNLKVIEWEKFLIWASFGVYFVIFMLTIGLAIFIAPYSQPIWEVADCAEDSRL